MYDGNTPGHGDGQNGADWQPLVCGTVFHHTSLLPPSLSIFCCRLKSHLFSLSYPAFWLLSHLYSARTVTHTIITYTFNSFKTVHKFSVCPKRPMATSKVDHGLFWNSAEIKTETKGQKLYAPFSPSSGRLWTHHVITWAWTWTMGQFGAFDVLTLCYDDPKDKCYCKIVCKLSSRW